jgi:tetratricopeptide (TPR) repeat protein
MDKPKNVDEYIARQRAAIAGNPECGTSHYNLAIGLLGQKKYEEAEKEFLEAVECSPTLAEAYVQLGGICFQRGDLEGCLSYNKMATRARAGFSEGYGNIGFVKLQMGDIEDAIYYLEKALKFNRNFLQAYTTLGNAYLMQGDVDQSIKMNAKAIEIEPNFGIAHNNLAIAYLEKGLSEEAVKHCDKAKELGYEVAPEILEEIEKHRS